VSCRIQLLLELVLLLDKTDSSGGTQVLVKFRNRKFQDKVWGKRLGKPVCKALGEGYRFLYYYLYLSVFCLFPCLQLSLPICILPL